MVIKVRSINNAINIGATNIQRVHSLTYAFYIEILQFEAIAPPLLAPLTISFFLEIIYRLR